MLKNIGNYKWVKNAKNSAPIKLNVTCEVKDVSKKILKKVTTQVPQKPLHFNSVTIKDFNKNFKNHKLQFKSQLVKPFLIESASKFLFRDNSEANITYTDKAHGYIARNAIDITEDANHNIWIISDDGLIKYDGLKYYLYNLEIGLPTLSFVSILCDNQNKIWVNTEHGFFYIKNDSCFLPVTNDFDFQNFHGRNIAKDDKNRIWISSSNKGVVCINNDNTFFCIDKSSGLPNNDVGDIAFLKNKIYLSLLGEGLMIIDENTWTQLKIKDEHSFSDPYRNAVMSVLAVNDTLYLGTWAKGFIRITAKDSTLYSVSGVFNDRILRIVKTNNGIAYAIYGNGVVIQNANYIAHFNKQNGLIGNYSFSVFYDSYKNVWISDLEKGISRINENVFYKSQNKNNLVKISNVRYSPNKKHKWLFINGGILTEETDSSLVQYTLKTNTNNTSLEYVLDGYVNDNNEVWGASYANSGICNIIDNKAYFYFISNNEQERIFYNVLKSSDDKLWFANDKIGLVYYDLNAKQFYKKNISNGTISNCCVTLKKVDNLTICLYDKGMQKIEQTDCFDFCINNKVCAYKINDVLSINSGETIVSTSSQGLLILKNNDLYSLNTSNGLISNNVYRVYFDGKYIWVFTDKGIERIILKDKSVVFNRLFDNNYGIFINELNGYFQKNIFGGPQIISSNIYDFHPENENKIRPLPILKITQLIINDKDVSSASENNLSSSDIIHIKYKFIMWGHENEYTHLAVLKSENNDTIEYKIGDLGEVQLNDLSPGKYSFRVLVKNSLESFYSNPIKFYVSPNWYNTWWFRVLMFLMGVLIFKYFYKRKQLQNKRLDLKVKKQTEILRKEKIELEEKNNIIEIQNNEKDTLIQEIHHRVKNNLQFVSSLISMQINASSNEKEIYSLNDASRRIRAMALVHEMLYNQDDISGVNIKQYLQELIQSINELVNTTNIPIKFNVKSEELLFDTTKAIALGMITSELISNSIKYAFKDTNQPIIDIELEKNSSLSTYIFSVKDNGSGMVEFEDGRNKLGMRLISIFSRQLKGNYNFESKNGVKYSIEFYLK